MDPLSDVLGLLRPRKEMHVSGFEAGGDWALSFKAHDGIKCYALSKGSCWLSVDHEPEPIHLEQGQCFFMTRGYPFVMASNLDVQPADAAALFIQAEPGGQVSLCNRPDFSAVGGHFAVEADHAKALLECLPPVVCIRDKCGSAVLTWCLEQITVELSTGRPGSGLVVQHLAQMLLVQAFRPFISKNAAGGPSWIAALADRQVSAAMQFMHERPAYRWSLEELAAAVGMSRTSFAIRFKDKAGLSPMEYLTRWRMLVASSKMRTTNLPISVIAHAVGYESESAFSTAFKREMGRSPREYARAGGPGSSWPLSRSP